jgi:phage gp46-like protein
MMAVLVTDGDPKLFETGSGEDLSIVGGQSVMDEGLENAVYLSLFTPPGWWGNILSTSPSDRYESRIPELFRRTLTNQVRIDAEKYAADALAWMITERIADKITPTATILSVGVLGLAIKIEQPGREVIVRYQLSWAAMEVRVA